MEASLYIPEIKSADLMNELLALSDTAKRKLIRVLADSMIRRSEPTGMVECRAEDLRVTPFVKSIGIEMDLPESYDEKAEYKKYVAHKYK